MGKPPMKASPKLFWLVVASLGTGTLVLAADAFQVDTVHSSVLFKIKHQNVSYAYGRFNDVAGKFLVDEADPSKSTFDLTIKGDSIDTASGKRDTHLKGPDFFNVKQFPTITFKSKSVARAGKDYDVTGDLTLHGVTRPVTFHVVSTGTAKGMMGGTVSGVEASAVIKRSDFGMNYMVGPLGDEVTVTASLEGGRK
jgi:polyisoprenoid-binding protein YceI